MKNKISIIDVAREAGVSKSTVSRVMNGGSVSEKARNAVLQVIEEMNYYPNGMARGLRGAKTKVIGVSMVNDNPFQGGSITKRMAGMNGVLVQAGYSLLLVNADPKQNMSAIGNGYRFLREQKIDGLICIGMNDEEEEIRRMKDFREVVYTGERISERKGFRVYLGNYNYSRDIYQYLFINGHRRILTLAGNYTRREVQTKRQEAYLDVCRMFNEEEAENRMFDYASYQDENREYLPDLLKEFRRGKYTAVFTDTDTSAQEVISYFAKNGLQATRDYSIVTIYRSNNSARNSNITGVELSDYFYGESCARLMIDILEDPTLDYRDIMIPYKFHVRKSVKNMQKA